MRQIQWTAEAADQPEAGGGGRRRTRPDHEIEYGEISMLHASVGYRPWPDTNDANTPAFCRYLVNHTVAIVETRPPDIGIGDKLDCACNLRSLFGQFIDQLICGPARSIAEMAKFPMSGVAKIDFPEVQTLRLRGI